MPSRRQGSLEEAQARPTPASHSQVATRKSTGAHSFGHEACICHVDWASRPACNRLAAAMPVYTGPPVPLGLHTASVLETSGPFARQQAAAQPAPSARGGTGVTCSGSAASAGQDGSEATADVPADVNDSAVLQTVSLSFSYPGIGAAY